MKYINGKDVLPKQLLEQLQHYVQGKLLYVPRKENSRAGWGTLNGTRAMIRNRNREICRRYDEGATIQELMERYHLSEDSIRKILNKKTSFMVADWYDRYQTWRIDLKFYFNLEFYSNFRKLSRIRGISPIDPGRMCYFWRIWLLQAGRLACCGHFSKSNKQLKIMSIWFIVVRDSIGAGKTWLPTILQMCCLIGWRRSHKVLNNWQITPGIWAYIMAGSQGCQVSDLWSGRWL